MCGCGAPGMGHRSCASLKAALTGGRTRPWRQASIPGALALRAFPQRPVTRWPATSVGSRCASSQAILAQLISVGRAPARQSTRELRAGALRRPPRHARRCPRHGTRRGARRVLCQRQRSGRSRSSQARPRFVALPMRAQLRALHPSVVKPRSASGYCSCQVGALLASSFKCCGNCKQSLMMTSNFQRPG